MTIITRGAEGDGSIRFYSRKDNSNNDNNNNNNNRSHRDFSLVCQRSLNSYYSPWIAASPDGTLVAIAGTAPTAEARLFHMQRETVSGEFVTATAAMTLPVHPKGIRSIDFFNYSSNSNSNSNSNSRGSVCSGHRVVSCGGDGVWNVWDVGVQYQLQEDPHLLVQHSLTTTTTATTATTAASVASVSAGVVAAEGVVVTGGGECVALKCGADLVFCRIGTVAFGVVPVLICGVNYCCRCCHC